MTQHSSTMYILQAQACLATTEARTVHGEDCNSWAGPCPHLFIRRATHVPPAPRASSRPTLCPNEALTPPHVPHLVSHIQAAGEPHLLRKSRHCQSRCHLVRPRRSGHCCAGPRSTAPPPLVHRQSHTPSHSGAPPVQCTPQLCLGEA